MFMLTFELEVIQSIVDPFWELLRNFHRYVFASIV